MNLRRIIRICFLSLTEWRERWRSLLLCLVSGAILFLAQPRPGWWPLVFFGLAPFLLAVRSERLPVARFWLGWIFGMTYFYGAFFWLNTLIHYNLFIVIGIMLLAAVSALAPGALALIAGTWNARRPGLDLFFLIAQAALWCVVDWIRGFGTFAFPWGYLAYPLYRHPTFIQLGAWTGVYGITFVLFICNGAVARLLLWYFETIRGRQPSRNRAPARDGASSFPWLSVGVALLLCAANLILGATILKRAMTEPAHPQVTVGVIQPNVPQDYKLASYIHPDPEVRARLQNEMFDLNLQMLFELWNRSPDVEVFIFPESAVTDPNFFADATGKAALTQAAKRVGAALLFGADYETPPQPATSADDRPTTHHYNSAWFVDDQTGISPSVYSKRHLVPFGEHVPYFDKIPYFQDVIVQVGSFSKGAGPVVFEHKDIRLGPLICFESALAYLTRENVRAGSNLLAVITNDAWYFESSGLEQHFLQSVFRAVESRRSVVRAANTGVSGVISPYGIVQRRQELGTRNAFAAKVELRSELTFYTRFGDVFVLMAAGGALLAFVIHLKAGGTRREEK
ncbi:MAG: apolipoprotein N-acyltransferase [bacterium]